MGSRLGVEIKTNSAQLKLEFWLSLAINENIGGIVLSSTVSDNRKMSSITKFWPTVKNRIINLCYLSSGDFATEPNLS